MAETYPALQHMFDAAQILDALTEQVLGGVQEHTVGVGVGVGGAACHPEHCLPQGLQLAERCCCSSSHTRTHPHTHIQCANSNQNWYQSCIPSVRTSLAKLSCYHDKKCTVKHSRVETSASVCCGKAVISVRVHAKLLFPVAAEHEVDTMTQ